MSNSELVELLKRQEGKTIEFKKELSSKSHESLARTICAFANTAGGNILFGVEDKTKYIAGVLDVQSLEATIVNIIDAYIYPKIIPDIEILSHERMSILSIRIHPNSPFRPYFLKSKGKAKGTYIRLGASNRVADLQNIEELERISKNLSFEEQPVLGLDSNAIDFEALSNCFKSIKKIEKKDLRNFKLLTEVQGKMVPTNAGMILFGKDRQQYFPNAKIKTVRFSGITKDQSIRILDQKEIDSYPIIAVEEAVEFVRKHANYESELKNTQYAEQWSIKRMERWNIPMLAIREAITNAIVHADYSQRGSDIHIFIYQNRIEIQNPGLLVTGLDIEDLKMRKGISKLRNVIIGNIFYRLKFVEQFGIGINKIVEECEKYGLEEPKFEELPPAHFRVTIFTTPKQAPIVDGNANNIIDVLRYQYFLNRDQGLSTKEIKDRTNLSQRSIRNHLIALVKAGIISEIGRNSTDPKKKYYLRDDYAKIPLFIARTNIRQDLEDILNSGIFSENQKIKKIEEILKYRAESIPSEWHWRAGHMIGNVNGYAWAFGLAKMKAYREKVRNAVAHGDNNLRSFASSQFVKDYISNKRIEPIDYPNKGSLVVYWDEYEEVHHAAVVVETLSITVESKWGTFPIIFKHKLRDIPIMYGSVLKFYPAIDPKDAFEFFMEWSSKKNN